MAFTGVTNNHHTAILSDVVHKMCSSYYDTELALNHLRESTLPSRPITLQVLSDVKDVLFPDHRLEAKVRSSHTGYFIGGILERVHTNLCQQILWARSYDNPDANGETAERAEQDTMAFLSRLPELRSILAMDVQAALDGDPAARSFDEIIFCYPGFEAVSTYRIAHELYLLGVPLLPRIMTEAAHNETGCDIHPGATIGPSFFIDHATGVVIGETSLIGARVKLYQGVTLGALSFPKDKEGRLVRNTKRHPTIEDDVVIYAGATVLGGDTVIGAGSVIGGSCWITHSIPPDTTVMLHEPRMKYRGPGAQALLPTEPEWMI